MTLATRFRYLAAGLFLERPARAAGLSTYPDRLTRSGAEIVRRFRSFGPQPGPKATVLLHHIVTIEQWGQSRLRGFLGEPVDPTAESDAFAPPKGNATAILATFQATRAETIALARQIATAPALAATTVPHNDFGPLTAGGWLRYLDVHATIEMKRLR